MKSNNEQINRLIDLIKNRKPVDLSKDKNIKWIKNDAKDATNS